MTRRDHTPTGAATRFRRAPDVPHDELDGFAVLLERSGDVCELDGLFVEPERMRGGVGRRLVEDATVLARARGATRIDVVANPQAVAFYEAVGFVAAGEAQTRFGSAPRMSLSVSG